MRWSRTLKALPCPFCGEELVERQDDNGGWLGHKDEMSQCHISFDQLFDDEDITAWNKRAVFPIERVR